MQPIIVSVNLGPRTYEIVVTGDDIAGIGPFAHRHAKSNAAVLIIDGNVIPVAETVHEALAQAGFRCHDIRLASGEQLKSLDVARFLYDTLADLPADRNTLMVAVGGGVIGDLAGFVAATYARGLPWLVVPTTLLAMVDSAIGGKVGINHVKAKNLIGAFHQPVGVWSDIRTLQSLPEREYRSGLAEVVKYGVILDADLFAYLENHAAELLQRDPMVVRHVVARCCQLKANIVEQDEHEETGLRSILNYGHTFAHAFETAAGYGEWLHGEAVAAGMICASRLAQRRGLVSNDVTERQVRLLTQFGLPTKPGPWRAPAIITVMKSDKKTVGGKLRFVLPRRIGEVGLMHDVSEAEVSRVLQEAADEAG